MKLCEEFITSEARACGQVGEMRNGGPRIGRIVMCDGCWVRYTILR